MKYFIKRLAYIFIFLPVVFGSGMPYFDLPDKKRIERLPMSIAIFILAIGVSILGGIVFVGVKLFT